jgi:hypothetical protein
MRMLSPASSGSRAFVMAAAPESPARPSLAGRGAATAECGEVLRSSWQGAVGSASQNFLLDRAFHGCFVGGGPSDQYFGKLVKFAELPGVGRSVGGKRFFPDAVEPQMYDGVATPVNRGISVHQFATAQQWTARRRREWWSRLVRTGGFDHRLVGQANDG